MTVQAGWDWALGLRLSTMCWTRSGSRSRGVKTSRGPGRTEPTPLSRGCPPLKEVIELDHIKSFSPGEFLRTSRVAKEEVEPGTAARPSAREEAVPEPARSEAAAPAAERESQLLRYWGSGPVPRGLFRLGRSRGSRSLARARPALSRLRDFHTRLGPRSFGSPSWATNPKESTRLTQARLAPARGSGQRRSLEQRLCSRVRSPRGPGLSQSRSRW